MVPDRLESASFSFRGKSASFCRPFFSHFANRRDRGEKSVAHLGNLGEHTDNGIPSPDSPSRMTRAILYLVTLVGVGLLAGCESTSSSSRRPPRIEGRQEVAMPNFAGGDADAAPLKEDLIRLQRQVAREAGVWMDANQFVKSGRDPDGYWAGMKADYAARVAATDQEIADVEKQLRRLGVTVTY